MNENESPKKPEATELFLKSHQKLDYLSTKIGYLLVVAGEIRENLKNLEKIQNSNKK